MAIILTEDDDSSLVAIAIVVYEFFVGRHIIAIARETRGIRESCMVHAACSLEGER